MEDNYVFFWQSKSPFSNWHPSKFTVNDILYHNMEQYMMHSKAILMGDMETADKIMAITEPRAIKALGRQVKNFNPNLWDEKKFDIVFNGCKAKFTQNEKLKKALIETGNKTLVESSPFDRIWGIALDETAARKTDPQKWPGQNLLGKILTKLRNSLKKD